MIALGGSWFGVWEMDHVRVVHLILRHKYILKYSVSYSHPRLRTSRAACKTKSFFPIKRMARLRRSSVNFSRQ